MTNLQRQTAPTRGSLFTRPDGQPWGLSATIVWWFIASELVTLGYERLRNATGLSRIGAQNAIVHAVDLFAAWGLQFLALVSIVYLARMTLSDYLGWKRPRARDLVLGVGVVLALWGVVCASTLLTGETSGVADYRRKIAAGMTPFWFVLQWWPAIFLAPFVEECFFRGFIWRGAEPAIGKWGALLLTSLLFAVAHYNYYLKDGAVLWGTVAAYVVWGLFFGALRWRTGGTTVPIVVHALSNAAPHLVIVLMSALMP
jgi:CAAX protease family protein